MPLNIADYDTNKDYQTLLFEGDSGTGKSIAACYFPGPIYVASCDGRIRPVIEWHRNRKDVFYDIYTKFEQLNDFVDSLEYECPYKTVICPDPITMVSDFLMRYAFSLRGTTGESKGRKKGIVDITTVEDYNVETRGILDMLGNLKVAQEIHKFNLIVTAHLITTQYVKMGGTESHIRRDIVTAGRKVAAFIPIQFDEVYSFYTEAGRWKVNTYNDGVVAARSAFINMPKTIDWTEKDFYEAIKKYYVLTEKEKELKND